jgi:hypothetical protein
MISPFDGGGAAAITDPLVADSLAVLGVPVALVAVAGAHAVPVWPVVLAVGVVGYGAAVSEVAAVPMMAGRRGVAVPVVVASVRGLVLACGAVVLAHRHRGPLLTWPMPQAHPGYRFRRATNASHPYRAVVPAAGDAHAALVLARAAMVHVPTPAMPLA